VVENGETKVLQDNFPIVLRRTTDVVPIGNATLRTDDTLEQRKRSSVFANRKERRKPANR